MQSSRQRIHDAALKLFALYGFDGVSLQQIADEVGLHKSSLFHHYRNKLELATEVFEDAMAHVVDTMQPLAGDGPPALEQLLECMDQLSDYFADNPETARLIIGVMIARNGSDLRVPITAETDHPVVAFFQTLWSWLDRAKRAGVIRDVNIRQAIFNLIAVVVFYPAVAEETADIAGPEPFSPKHRAIRKRELRATVRAMLG